MAEAAAQAAWQKLVEVDSLQVLAIVDNESDGISNPCWCCDPAQAAAGAPVQYTSEFTWWTQAVLDGQQDAIDVSRLVAAGHGLSLLLTATIGNSTKTLLVDGGPRKDLWAMNAEQLGVDASKIDAAVLTHWHVDHSVGLHKVAEMASKARMGTQASAMLFDLHPQRPHRRGFKTSAGHAMLFNADVEVSELQELGCEVELHDEPHTLLDGAFFVSGAIPRVTSYEVGTKMHVSQWEAGGPLDADPLIMDERCIAIRVKGLGAVVITGCSHAGVVNVCKHIKSLASATNTPLAGVIGGFHLSGRGMEERVPGTVSDLQAELPSNAVLLAGHCTGWRAKAALAAAFPQGFQPCVVGGRYLFKGR